MCGLNYNPHCALRAPHVGLWRHLGVLGPPAWLICHPEIHSIVFPQCTANVGPYFQMHSHKKVSFGKIIRRNPVMRRSMVEHAAEHTRTVNFHC